MKTAFKPSLLFLALAMSLTACFGCGENKNGAAGTAGAKGTTVRVHSATGIDFFTTTEGKNYGLYGVQGLNLPIQLNWADNYKSESRTFFSNCVVGKDVSVVVKKEFKPSAPTPGITYDKALVYLPDGTLLNEKMIEEGYVHVNKDELKDDSETLNRFLAIEKAARAAKKGAWKYWFDKMPAD